VRWADAVDAGAPGPGEADGQQLERRRIAKAGLLRE